MCFPTRAKAPKLLHQNNSNDVVPLKGTVEMGVSIVEEGTPISPALASVNSDTVSLS
jgi:hypothetical protein